MRLQPFACLSFQCAYCLVCASLEWLWYVTCVYVCVCVCVKPRLVRRLWLHVHSPVCVHMRHGALLENQKRQSKENIKRKYIKLPCCFIIRTLSSCRESVVILMWLGYKIKIRPQLKALMCLAVIGVGFDMRARSHRQLWQKTLHMLNHRVQSSVWWENWF